MREERAGRTFSHMAGSVSRSARVVVLGAGFAGASLLRHLPPALRRPGETLLIDRREEYTFVPLIHEVAVGRGHPKSVSSPIAPLCAGVCEFLHREVSAIDLTRKTVETRDGPVVIVGGGATGVEVAAEVGALFDYLGKRAPRSPSEEPRVVLIEATDRLMDWLEPYFDNVARKTLSGLRVEVRLNAPVEEASAEGVHCGEGWLKAATRVWTAGVEAPPLVRGLPGKHDAAGRAHVDQHLTLPDHPEGYVLGDAGMYTHPRLGPLPPTASVAVQQGPWVARDLKRRLRGAQSKRGRPPFRFFDRGYVVSLGPESAVANAVGLKLRGPAAQALYRSVLLYYMKSRRDRILTGADWAMERTLGRVGFGNRQPSAFSGQRGREDTT